MRGFLSAESLVYLFSRSRLSSPNLGWLYISRRVKGKEIPKCSFSVWLTEPDCRFEECLILKINLMKYSQHISAFLILIFHGRSLIFCSCKFIEARYCLFNVINLPFKFCKYPYGRRINCNKLAEISFLKLFHNDYFKARFDSPIHRVRKCCLLSYSRLLGSQAP